jgi:cation diffusion facilitator CzcD-associated flavoprotein CzcO
VFDTSDSYDFKSKRVGIIGNGSSAIQIIPSLQKLEGTKLTCFMRSPTWIAGAFGDNAMKQLGLDPSQTECKSLLQQYPDDPNNHLT